MEITFDVLTVLYAVLHSGDIKRSKLVEQKFAQPWFCMLQASFVICVTGWNELGSLQISWTDNWNFLLLV